MARQLIEIPDELAVQVKQRATLLGESEDEIVARAVKLFLEDAAVEPAETTDSDEVAAARSAAAGMWKDRTDLPDLRELRSEWTRRFDRLFSFRLAEEVRQRAAILGETENDVIARAIRHYLEDAAAESGAGTVGEDRAMPDRLTLLRTARGMWKDRDDIPDPAVLRREADDRSARLIGHD